MTDVELLVDGKAYSGWKSIDVQCSIEQLASTFEMAVSEVAPNGDAFADLQDGQAVTVKLDGETVITGFIDDFEISHGAHDHTIIVRGRDISADLVDCSVKYKPGQWTNQGMLAIVNDLLKDYAINVTVKADLGDRFKQWSTEPGETVFENLDKLARHRGVLIISDGLGGIVITQPGTEMVGTALKLGENILSGQLTRSCQQRFSEYTVLGNRQRDDFNEPTDIRPSGKAKDAYIKRHRPLLCLYEDANATTKTVSERAKWQAAVNAARGQRAIITVQGWRHADGIWRINKLVPVTNSLLRLDNETLLIVSVGYKLDSQGTRCDLSLAPRNSFLVDKLPKEITKHMDAEE